MSQLKMNAEAGDLSGQWGWNRFIRASRSWSISASTSVDRNGCSGGDARSLPSPLLAELATWQRGKGIKGCAAIAASSAPVWAQSVDGASWAMRIFMRAFLDGWAGICRSKDTFGDTNCDAEMFLKAWMKCLSARGRAQYRAKTAIWKSRFLRLNKNPSP